GGHVRVNFSQQDAGVLRIKEAGDGRMAHCRPHDNSFEKRLSFPRSAHGTEPQSFPETELLRVPSAGLQFFAVQRVERRAHVSTSDCSRVFSASGTMIVL